MVPPLDRHHLFEDIYQKAFKPFFQLIFNHPGINATLFYSGVLLEWLEKKHPEFQEALSEAVSKKKFELLGGGYWEPMLSLIPASDRVGQIEVMTTYLRKQFGKRARGGWITGQVWDAHLASSLRSSGVDYAFITEQAFPQTVDFRAESPVIAEDQGKTIVLFPVKNRLIDQFLKVPPEEMIASLKALQSDKETVVSLLVNGLTFGGNGSNKICYEEEWLKKFFDLVEKSQSWLECVLPGQYLRASSFARERRYISGPSYKTLMNWTQDFLKDGDRQDKSEQEKTSQYSYRRFLSKYRESRFLHAKMMHVVVLTNQLRRDKYRKKNAKEELWRGQAHYAYWHGPSGGIYNIHLRNYAYNALLEAEKIARERGVFKAALTSLDVDMDGEKEYIYSGANFNAYIHLTGGALFELDYLPVRHNYLATFSRYREDYHPPGIQELGCDLYPRQSFQDHVMHPDACLENFNTKNYREHSPFPGLQYRVEKFVRDQDMVSMSAIGDVDNNDAALKIEKTYLFVSKLNQMKIEYTLTNLSPKTLNFLWGTEINLALSEESNRRKVFINSKPLDSKAEPDEGESEEVENWLVFDEERGVSLLFTVSEQARLWRFPFYTESLVYQKLCQNYQSSCFLPHWEMSILPQESRQLSLSLQIGRARK